MLFVQNGRRIATICSSLKTLPFSCEYMFPRLSTVSQNIFNMECFLCCCVGTHNPILLPDGTPVVVGRSRQTKIADKKCSKSQVKMTANYKDKDVRVIQLGSNPCLIGDRELTEGETVTIKSGDKIGLLHKKFQHYVSFVTPKDELPKTTVNKTESSNKMDGVQSKKSPGKAKKRKTSGNIEESITPPSKKLKAGSDQNGLTKANDANDDCPDDVDYEEVKKEFGEEMVLELKSKKRKAGHNSTGDDSAKIRCQKKDMQKQSSSKLAIPCEKSQWYEIPGELFVYTSQGVEGREKVAGFDIDGTIITTKSGKVFAVNTEDWKIFLPEIPGRLKKLWKEGYKIVFFTNQNGIAKKKISVPDFKKKVENIVNLLGVPIQVLISPGTGHYRKPMTGMWRYLIEKVNQRILVDSKYSMYIGDAAGRPVNWEPKRKKDFSCSDRAFAANIGIQFYTPEEFFLNKKPAPFNWPPFDPRKIPDVPLFSPSTSTLISKDPELVIMVGSPASGKTTFAKEHLVPQGYIRVNRDTLGTWQKCVSACGAALSQGKRVVVDNTSPDMETRKRYVECAQHAKVPARCFVMDVSLEHAKHNNTFRESTNADKSYKPVGFMAFNNYKSSYQEPQLSEGFTEILKINFKPKFTSKELYCQFLRA